MSEHCTCGTRLVENARFCHACGRPTREIDLVDETPPAVVEAPPPAQTKIAPPAVGFGNPIALRVAFLMSLGIMMMQVVPVLNRLFIVWWLGAGWCAVLLYRRLTGLSLSVPAGARLGSITGVLTFVSNAIVLSLTMFFTGRQMLNQLIQQDARMAEIVNDPPLLAVFFLLVIAVIFTVVVGVCAAGGALGARFSARRAG